MSTGQPQTVVRLSLRWVILGIVAIIALGIIGGFIGAQFGTPQIPLTSIDGGRQLVSTVQEVTVSPNTLAETIVSQQERSVLLLAHGSKENPTILSSGVAVTSDGVVAAIHPGVRDEVFAIDSAGSYVPLQSLGQDAVYGITFYRAENAVFPLLELANADPHVGSTLLALSRSEQTLTPVAQPFKVTRYVLPSENDPVAWHRVGQTDSAVSFSSGTPLVTDEGKIAALSTSSTDNRIIPISYLRRSLERLVAGTREQNPYVTLGLVVSPIFTASEEKNGITFAFEIQSVTPNSSAAALRARDKITSINGQELTWESDITNLLSLSLPITVTVERAGQEQTITLNQTTSR